MYNFSFAALPAKYPSEYLNFIGAKFVEVTDKVAYFMPKAPKVGTHALALDQES